MSAETKSSAEIESSVEAEISAKVPVKIAMKLSKDLEKQIDKLQALQNQRQRLRMQPERLSSLRERLSSLPLATDGSVGEETKLSDATRAQVWREIDTTLAKARESVSCVIAPGAIKQVQHDGLDNDKFEQILHHIASLETSIDNVIKLYRQHAGNYSAASETTLESDLKLAAEKGLAELVKDVTRLVEAIEAAEKQASNLQSMFTHLNDVLKTELMRAGAPEEKSNWAARELEKTQEISINNLEFIELIGEGGFGKVYQGVWRPFGTKVAIKVINNGDSSELQTLNIQTEIEFLKKLPFEHVVRYYGAARDVSRFCLVMELMEEGSLHSKIHSNDPLPWSERLNLAKQSAVPLVYLHSHDIVHSDVKPANFLVGRKSEDDIVVKICDFGLTAVVKASQTGRFLPSRPTGGTLEWMAPERLAFAYGGDRTFGKPSTKTDVYSFGVLLWELATRAKPYEDYKDAQFIELVKAGGRLPIPETEPKTPPAFAQLIEDCWAQDPSKRPTMEEVLDRLTSIDASDAPAPAPLPSPAPAPQSPASPAYDSDQVQGPSNPASEASPGAGPGAQHQAGAPHGPSDEQQMPTNVHYTPDLRKASKGGWNVAGLFRIGTKKQKQKLKDIGKALNGFF